METNYLTVIEARGLKSELAEPCSLRRFQGRILPASSSFQGPQVFLGLWLHHSSLCPVFTSPSLLVQKRNEADFLLEDLEKSGPHPSEMSNIS